jgi:hypothetical protein
MDSLLARAGAWFLHSGIQEPDGGVARFYVADRQLNRPVSTEITGYAVSVLLYLAARTRRSEYRERAEQAGQFLVRRAWDPAAAVFPFECSPERPLAYFFDCGIIARALVQLWRATGGEEYRRYAVACGQAMAADFPRAENGVEPVLELPAKRPLARGETWSRQPGCYQLKAALAWYELHAAAGREGFREAYEDMLGRALASHGDFLPGSPDPHRVMDRLHAYCYFLEGLLPVARRPEAAEALRAGIAAVSRLLREIRPEFARSDVYAQLLRLRILAEAAGAAEVDREAAGEEAACLRRFAIDDPDPRLRGGFYFGARNGSFVPHVNPVSASFAVQALALWDDFRAGRRAASWQALI